MLWQHFECLNPSSKKSPRCRGYEWFCEDCESDDSDGEEEHEGKNTGKENAIEDEKMETTIKHEVGNQEIESMKRLI